ncbi:MAG: bifunctional hydroxymethylpyrimidine kinase/phosphomethylpyrimidine kinase [Chloroflexi bacterium]|nr:bifunctional hydroxymethylpyrimidine kinase/phosphomethylpyrimidine kinase [Chloroflexota bacterium]
MDRARLTSLLEGFRGKRLLVLGDMVHDEYWFVQPTGRISREAPIPILRERSRQSKPGGATNLGCNGAALGATVHLAGVIGDDASGRDLSGTLQDQGLDTSGLVVDVNRPTYTKIRVVAGSTQEMPQQVARVDRFDDRALDPAVGERVIQHACRLLPEVDALLFSDYEAGVITPNIVEAILPEAVRAGKLTCVDSHGDLFRFPGVTVATPNQPEAEATLHRPLTTRDELERGGAELVDRMQAKGVLITRGSEGMSVFEIGGTCHHLPVFSLEEVRDVTGAGDTVAATFTLALLAGASMLEAAQLGNVAAALVVRKVGAATTTTAEIAQALATVDAC